MFKKMFFAAALVISAAMLAPQGLSAQKGVVKVQGHPHELLTRKAAEGTWRVSPQTVSASGDVANIVLDSIHCWVSDTIPGSTAPIDSAVLLVKWSDKKVVATYGDSILAWGYRWTTYSIYIDSVYGPDTTYITKTTLDMIRAVANTDCRFIALLQNTSGTNFTVGGFGYNLDDDVRIPADAFAFDQAGADTTVSFHYTGSPNCSVGQRVIPYNVKTQTTDAFMRASGPEGKGTGIIRHPFDADYGYPAYDYDYWKLLVDEPFYEWQSGWAVNGYWAFYIKNTLVGPFNYAPTGIAQRILQNHSVDGFVFQPGFSSLAMSGDFTAPECDCGCNAKATVAAKRSRK